MSPRDRKPVDFSAPEHVDSSNEPQLFHISALLQGHSDDVRALTSDRSGRLYSASRDGTVKSWRRTTSNNVANDQGWEVERTWNYLHTGFINSICWVGTNRTSAVEDSEPQGLICTGGQDSLIQIVALSAPATRPRTLIGHGHNVCCLHASRDGKTLVSGSWDYTARIWDLESGECLQVLDDHTAAVWDVLSLDAPGHEGTIITACADGLVRSFRNGERKELFKGHTGPVRSLAKVLPEEEEGLLFASASNDGTIRIWHINGYELNVLDGHDSFIYSLVAIPSSNQGGLASSGEDGIIRIWNEEDGELDQEIIVPPLSVWALTTILPNGDLACGCSDNLIWIFSREANRRADQATQRLYDEGIEKRAQRMKAKESGGNESTETKTPQPTILDKEALKERGTKEGEVKLIKTSDDGTHAYVWNGTTWDDVGQVVSEAPSTQPNDRPQQKMEYEGVEYDFVFSIDVKDDEPPLKLPYNLTDDVHETAVAFVEKHALPQSYTDQIVEFIRASAS